MAIVKDAIYSARLAQEAQPTALHAHLIVFILFYPMESALKIVGMACTGIMLFHAA